MGHILSGYRVTVFFNCSKHPPVNRAMQITLRILEPDGTVTRTWYLQLSLFTTNQQWSSGIFENLLTAQISVN